MPTTSSGYKALSCPVKLNLCVNKIHRSENSFHGLRGMYVHIYGRDVGFRESKKKKGNSEIRSCLESQTLPKVVNTLLFQINITLRDEF